MTEPTYPFAIFMTDGNGPLEVVFTDEDMKEFREDLKAYRATPDPTWGFIALHDRATDSVWAIDASKISRVQFPSAKESVGFGLK